MCPCRNPAGSGAGPARAGRRARTPDAVLADVGKAAFDREAALAIGEKKGVQAFFVDEIEVTKVKVRLISAANGATLWTDSVIRQGTVGSVGMEDGVPVFSVRNKSAAMGQLLREVMFRLTWDFRPTGRHQSDFGGSRRSILMFRRAWR